jgi:hypothetical protein
MKTTYTIAAIAMFAVILGMGALAPAMAAPHDNANPNASVGKVTICHWQEEVLDDPLTTDVIEYEAAEWVPIDISRNAEKAHVDVHTDGTDFDVELSEEDIIADFCGLRNAVE